MMAIFHDMIKKTMELFMDDFSVFGDSFDSCLFNLDKMLKHCEDTNLVLNWEECHFMCMLGHKISKSGIEVDRAKVDVITKLPHPTTVKGVRSFLVLGQRKMKHFQPYASKTMTEAQIHYTTMEKEMLVVVYAFETFRPYLVLSKSIVNTDHSALKYLMNKQDAKPRDFGEKWLLHCRRDFGELALRDQAYENSLIYKERTKKLHDSKIKNRIFNVGDRVLLFNSRLKIFLGKLKTRWIDPKFSEDSSIRVLSCPLELPCLCFAL
ncbi:reverse transcriptase domain-containing protein [Tanacetum coccineum]